MDGIELSLFANRIESICEEMGVALRRSAFSPNIRDRLDFSCALFDHEGELCAQAAHIPVHLGSMAYAMRDLVRRQAWSPGDMLIVNDPFLGGTHLPDVTLIAPLYHSDCLVAFVANRAHHADIGADSPGSMPISTCLEDEGLVVPPTLLVRAGKLDQALFQRLIEATGQPATAAGDFSAQMSANRIGVARMLELLTGLGVASYQRAVKELNAYAERLAQAAWSVIPLGEYRFTDYMDDDGQGSVDLPISVAVRVAADASIEVDFSGSALQVAGNINCPMSVAAAAVYYVFRCLMPPQTPACAGSFRRLRVHAPAGTLLNACRPAAVAAGNVETSSRIVDVLLGALAQALPEVIPAASQGSMNNLAFGTRQAPGQWDYYETLAGGMGAGPRGPGLHAVQTHMTNTLNTPIEVLESNYPLRVRRYAIRRGSGGPGRHRGGDGLLREYEFLRSAQVTVLSERRRHPPWGLAGGGAGARGENRLNGVQQPGKFSAAVDAGDCLTVLTPGGGGWGSSQA